MLTCSRASRWMSTSPSSSTATWGYTRGCRKRFSRPCRSPDPKLPGRGVGRLPWAASARVRSLDVLEQQESGGGIGNGNVVIAVQLADRAGQGAPGRNPIDQLDALRARELDQIIDAVVEQRAGIVNQEIHAP